MKKFVKLTEDDVCNIITNGENIADYLVEDVKWSFIGNICDLSAEYEWCLAECESPIEQMLAMEFERLVRNGMFDISRLVDVIAIEKQKEIECENAKYRVDFAIFVKYWNSDKIYVVECDGHEFHQKTKEQVERDNKRARDLQLAGYEIIRFSGTEIYHRPYQCALEVKRIIQAPAIKFLEGILENEENKNS